MKIVSKGSEVQVLRKLGSIQLDRVYVFPEDTTNNLTKLCWALYFLNRKAEKQCEYIYSSVPESNGFLSFMMMRHILEMKKIKIKKSPCFLSSAHLQLD